MATTAPDPPPARSYASLRAGSSTDPFLSSPAPFIDHTLLRPTAGRDDILRLCDEAVEYGFAAVCIPPRQVAAAVAAVYGSDVRVATVVGFPLGFSSTSTKLFEVGEAVALGAQELDLVIDLAAAQAGRFADVEEEVARLVCAVPGVALKVIIECCLFDAATKVALTEVVVRSGAAMVKTSTGFSSSGATVGDVALLAQTSAGRIGVKAAGGIRDWIACRALLDAGATRLGTSAGVAIMAEWLAEQQRQER